MVNSFSSFLTDSRINLGPLLKEHIPIYLNWYNDANFRQYFRNVFPVTESHFEKLLNPSKTPEAIHFEIIHKQDNLPIGHIYLFGIDWINRLAIVGVGIGNEKYQNNHYGVDSLRLICDYAFRELNLHKLKAYIYEPNIVSWKMVERVGFQREAILKEEFEYQGKLYSDFIYTLLRQNNEKTKLL